MPVGLHSYPFNIGSVVSFGTLDYSTPIYPPTWACVNLGNKGNNRMRVLEHTCNESTQAMGFVTIPVFEHACNDCPLALSISLMAQVSIIDMLKTSALLLLFCCIGTSRIHRATFQNIAVMCCGCLRTKDISWVMR